MLHTRAAPVTHFDSSLRELIADMFDTMRAAPGVGLAATQIGVSLQVFVYEWTAAEVTHRGVAVNPILKLGEYPNRPIDEDSDLEGCLSFPGYRFPLLRNESAVLTAQDASGDRFTINAEGWLARIFQHEYDHLQGMLYVDRLEADFLSEISQITREENWGVPGRSWHPERERLEN